MPRFEVFVPATAPAVPDDLTLRVDAEHWLAALKAGLQRIGDVQPTSHVLCDVQADGSIHVTDPRNARVFRIQELGAALSGPAGSGSDRASARADRIEQLSAPTTPPPARIGRGGAAAEEALADLFERVVELGRHRDRRGGLGFLLDLAMKTIGCEAGSVFTAQLAGRDLDFAVARGSSAGRIAQLGLTVPMGAGIVGFCAQENVCLAVSDVRKDPRFHRAISQAIGHDTRSLLCAPMARGGRIFGAIEVLDKTGGRPFDQADVAVLSYLAHQGAEFLFRLEG